MPAFNIKLYFSHAVEQLAVQLHEQLQIERHHSDNILAPQEVIVPNGSMQKYLQLTMAARQGICANIEFPFLETGLFQAMLRLGADQDIRLMNHGDLTLRIWQILSQPDALDESLYQPIRRYLSDTDSAQLASKKRWQLSLRLALLLLDYELKRPEMVQAWIHSKTVFSQSLDQELFTLERMQKDLYMSLFKSDSKQLTLFQMWLRLRSQQQPTKQTGSLHVFAPSRLSQFHRQLLIELAVRYEIHIYQLNVCAEYWEDMSTAGEDSWLEKLRANTVTVLDAQGQPKSNFNAEMFVEMDDSQIENPLLKSWGKPGREALKLYSELENDALHYEVTYSDEWLDANQPRNNGILHLIQDAILNRAPGSAVINDWSQMSSLQISKAPSKEREVEAVYNSILWHLHQNPGWQPADFAVLVTDMSAYRFVLEQVFDSWNHQTGAGLPYAIVDATASVESEYARAVMGLFTIMQQGHKRSDVFEWLRNPCVMAALQLTDQEWSDWLKTVDELGAFAGFDHLYESAASSQDAEPSLSQLYTWSQALKRLHLQLANDHQDHSDLDATSIGKLSVLMEYIHKQNEVFQNAHSASQWQTLINRLLDQLLVVPNSSPKELSVQLALSQSLSRLTETIPNTALGLDDVLQYLKSELTALSASKGQYLTGGVVCAALQPMRPIPFKVIYVLGLDGNTFPGGLRHETLDLSLRSRRIGDINGIENKQYLFLETLMCAREKLLLSYVGEDLAKAESMPRSSVLDELANFASTLLDATALDINRFPEHVINLHSSDDLLQPHGQQPWLLANHIPVVESNPDPSATVDMDIESPKDAESVMDVDIAELASFLEHASVNWMKQAGMIIKRPEMPALANSEPLVLDGLMRYQWYSEVVKSVVIDPTQKDLLTEMRHMHKQKVAASQWPIDFYVDWSEVEQIAVHDSYTEMLSELSGWTACEGPIQWGTASTEHTPTQRLPHVNISLDSGQTVNLHGVTDDLFAAAGLIQGQLVTSAGLASPWHKTLLKPFLSWCLMHLSEVPVAKQFSLHQFFKNRCLKQRFQLSNADFSLSQLHQYMKSLIQDYLNNQGAFMSMALVGGVRVIEKKEQKKIFNYNGFRGKIHPFAYDGKLLSSADHEAIRAYCIENSKYPEHMQLAGLVTIKQEANPFEVMQRRYRPLHAMVHTAWDEQ